MKNLCSGATVRAVGKSNRKPDYGHLKKFQRVKMVFSDDDKKKSIIKIWIDTKRTGKCHRCGKRFNYVAAFAQKYCDKCYDELIQIWINDKK